MRERREPVLATEAAPAAAVPGRAPLSPPRTPLAGTVASAALHLAALALLLLGWPQARPLETPPIPVRLVVLPPPPPTKPEPRPPRGPLASDDFGDVKPIEPGAAKAEVAQRPAAPRPAEQRDAAAPATPPPEPAPPAVSPPTRSAAAIPLPTPKPPVPTRERVATRPAPAPQAPPRPGAARPRLASRPAKYPGPAATRDEYLHYVNMLILRHLDLLPQTLIAGRRGITVIGMTVLDNGVVAALRVERSSGYPDLDRRVEQMVAAAGRFPPLPQWFQGFAMPLQFEFAFHEALQR